MNEPRLRAPDRYRAELAGGEGIVASQRLRYRIFAEELGAELPEAHTGLDRDEYDPHCLHLLVRDLTSGDIVACTRLLTDEAAHRAGGFYSQNEFEMDRILVRPGRFVEVGRTCVDPLYRNGAVIATLWQGIGRIVNAQKVDFLFGCASVSLAPDPVYAAAVLQRLLDRHRADTELRVSPLLDMPAAPDLPAGLTPRMPPLLRAYVNLGAKACGEPCWDPAFNVADVFMLLNLREIDSRYGRHFLSAETSATPRERAFA